MQATGSHATVKMAGLYSKARTDANRDQKDDRASVSLSRRSAAEAKAQDGAVKRVMVKGMNISSQVGEDDRFSKNKVSHEMSSMQNVDPDREDSKSQCVPRSTGDMPKNNEYRNLSPENKAAEMTPSHSEYTLYNLQPGGFADGDRISELVENGKMNNEIRPNQVGSYIDGQSASKSATIDSQLGSPQRHKHSDRLTSNKENIQLEQEFFDTVRDTMKKHFSDALQQAVGKIKTGLRTVEEREHHIIKFYECLIKEEDHFETGRNDQSTDEQSEVLLNESRGEHLEDNQTFLQHNSKNGQRLSRKISDKKISRDKLEVSGGFARLYRSDNPKNTLLKLLASRELLEKTLRDIQIQEKVAKTHYSKRMLRICFKSLISFRAKRAQYKGQTDQNEELYHVSQKYNKLLEDLEAEIRDTVKETSRIGREKQAILEKLRGNGAESFSMLDSDTAKRMTPTAGTEPYENIDIERLKNESSSNKKKSESQGQSSDNPSKRDKKGPKQIQYMPMTGKQNIKSKDK